MVQALLSSEVDINRDNFISLNEVYNYILPKLQLETKQNPQRNFDGAVGELAISKSNILLEKPDLPREGETRRSQLAVSTNSIEIKDVMFDETLREEIIDVFDLFNKDNTNLNWSVECDDKWITTEKHSGFFTVKLNPEPGINRGRIYVRDKTGGGVQRIQIMVQKQAMPVLPKLELSTTSVDFGKISYNAPQPIETVRITNTGGGDLKTKITSSGENFDVEILGDLINIKPHTDVIGIKKGEIIVESRGGNSTIDVVAEVEKGAVLKVIPEKVDFKTIDQGENKTIDINVSNEGGLKLEWSYSKQGDFFTITRNGDSLKLNFKADPGSYQGAIFIKSNGGDRTVNVKGKVKSVSSKSAPEPKENVDISGVWSVMGLAYLVFTRQGRQYVYKDCNIMGVACGEGTATVDGNSVTISGYNITTGQVYGQFVVTGNIMTGYITTLGQQQQFTLTKQNSSSPNFMNLLNLFNY